MFINDIFKKKLNESLRDGEYYTFRVFFDDGTDETLNFSSDDIDWDRVGARRGKQVVDVKRLGGIQGSQSDSPHKPHDFPDDRGLARAQRAYDKQLPEGGFDIPEIPRAPTPKPPKEKDIAEAHGPYGKTKPGDLEKIQKAKEREKKNAPGQLRRALPPSKQRYRDSSIEYFAKLDEQDVEEGSVQDRLHQRHQEQRKKSGLPNPKYYEELKASYDIENDQERLARQAEIKQKYRVSEATKQRSAYKGSAGAQAIAQASGVKNVNRIIPGQRLNIPGQDTPYVVQKGDTLDAIASRFSAAAAAMEPTFTGMAGSELTGRIDGSDPSNPDAKEIRKPRLATGVKNAQRASWGDETSDPAGEVIPMSRRLLSTSVKNAQYAGRIRDPLPGDTDKITQKIDGQTDTADNTTTTQSMDSTNASAPALNKRLDFVNKEPTNEAIPYALSAANAAAEYRRQGAAGGGYRGRIDIPVQSREDYLAVGQMLLKAARAEGQKIDYGLSDGVMSIFSDSMTADELDEFIDRVLDQGLAEGRKDDSLDTGPDGKLTARGEEQMRQYRQQKREQERQQIIAKHTKTVKGEPYGVAPSRISQSKNEVDWKEANKELRKKGLDEQGVAEAGPFSYGAKKPRKGSVADLAAKKRKEQEKDRKPIEPRDQMVGIAKVLPKDLTEGKQVTSSWQITFKDGKTKEMKGTYEQGSGPSNDQILVYAQAQNPSKQVASVKQQYTPNAKTTKINRVEKSGRVDWSDRDNKGSYYIKKEAVNEDIERYLDEMHRAGYDIVTERATLCPECGGVAYEDKMLAEKQDACYHKVKSRYKVWPSAYASGALVRCRKKGAKNWGNKSKK
jgi:hypothetical protein